MSITKKEFGKTTEGEQCFLYTLSNGTVEADITDYGATLVAVRTPDSSGTISDVLLGYDTTKEYQEHDCYFGATIGRHGNRIGGASFSLNGKVYRLDANNGQNNLHGGADSFDKKVWNAQMIKGTAGEQLVFSRMSPDGEANFPGNLLVSVTFSLSAENELLIRYFAVSDQDTVVNLTNHAYFNLKGQGCGNILDHSLKINAGFYTPLDPGGCPTGQISEVCETPFDFLDFHTIGERASGSGPYFEHTGGYDHNFVLRTAGRQMVLAAEAYEQACGRTLHVYTDMPGVQLYAGNCIGDMAGKGGSTYGAHSGFCLETQYFPDAMANPHFPSPVLKKGQAYDSTTIYQFGVR